MELFNPAKQDFERNIPGKRKGREFQENMPDKIPLVFPKHSFSSSNYKSRAEKNALQLRHS
jgi:hypothetical protein